MPTDHQECLAFAQAMNEQRDALGCAEQPSRTVAHKAYYAAYHCLRKAFPNVNGTGNGGVHMRFINALRENGTSGANPESLVLAMELEQLKRIRSRADYKIDQTFKPQAGEEAIRRAIQILNRF